MHTLIIASVYRELSNLIDHVEKPVSSEISGRKITHGYLEHQRVKILTTGPGIVNTVQALTTAIEHSRPAMIIQTGCAGAFTSSGLQIGDIGIATEEIDAQLG